MARGADGVMQFQWRQSRAGAESFHSGMVPHGGEDTRVFRETVEIGAELAALADVRGTRCDAQVALVLDWDSWWALEQEARPADLDYVAEVRAWYRALWRRGVLVDLVGPEADLDGYRVVVAPATFVLADRGVANLAGVVERGGQLVVGYQTGIVDEHVHVRLGGYLGGALRDALGVQVEEFAPTATGTVSGTPAQQVRLAGLAGGGAGRWAEVLRVRDAEVLATYEGREPHGWLLDGRPAITRRRSGSGGAGWYVSTLPADLGAVVDAVLAEAGIDAAELPAGVEVVRRGDRLFVLNHSKRDVHV